jgi:predicted NBD/HSP70 family sugar kinase
LPPETDIKKKGRIVDITTEIQSGYGRPIAQAVSSWLPTAAARVRALSVHAGYVAEKVALGQVFSEYFGFPLPIIIPPNSPSS